MKTEFIASAATRLTVHCRLLNHGDRGRMASEEQCGESESVRAINRLRLFALVASRPSIFLSFLHCTSR